jgi:hypothetical protein
MSRAKRSVIGHTTSTHANAFLAERLSGKQILVVVAGESKWTN